MTITSYNEWGEGTQIEPAAADRLGYARYDAPLDKGEGETNVAAALKDKGRGGRGGQSESGRENGGGGGGGGGGGDPELYLKLTREFAHRLRGAGFDRDGDAAQARDEL